MADEAERPAVPHSGVAVMTDPEDKSAPQNIEPTAALTAGQLAVLKERIRNHLMAIRARKDRAAFKRATAWVFNAFSWDLHLQSDFVPRPSYGAAFLDFVNFVHDKEHTAEAEQVLDDEEPNP